MPDLKSTVEDIVKAANARAAEQPSWYREMMRKYLEPENNEELSR